MCPGCEDENDGRTADWVIALTGGQGCKCMCHLVHEDAGAASGSLGGQKAQTLCFVYSQCPSRTASAAVAHLGCSWCLEKSGWSNSAGSRSVAASEGKNQSYRAVSRLNEGLSLRAMKEWIINQFIANILPH